MIKYRVIDKITGKDITEQEDWVLTPDGQLAVNEYGDLTGRIYAKAVSVDKDNISDLLYIIRTNMTSITRYVRHKKEDHPNLSEGQFLDQHLKYKELAETAVSNILNYVNGQHMHESQNKDIQDKQTENTFNT